MEKYPLNWIIKKEEDNLFIYTSKIYTNVFNKQPIVMEVSYTRMTTPVLNSLHLTNIFSTNKSYNHSGLYISVLDFDFFETAKKIEDEKLKIGYIADSICHLLCSNKGSE